MLSYVTTYGTVSAEVDETDAASLLAGIAALYGELDDDDRLNYGGLVMHEVAPIAAGTRLSPGCGQCVHRVACDTAWRS